MWAAAEGEPSRRRQLTAESCQQFGSTSRGAPVPPTVGGSAGSVRRDAGDACGSAGAHVVARRGAVPDLPALLHGHERRRGRRPARHHRSGSTICSGSASTGIWLDPIMVSPNDDWGYDVADYVDVDPALGTLADADTLIEEAAQARHPRACSTSCPNHTSDRHPWFVDAKSSRDSRAPRLVRVGRSEARRLGRRTTGRWRSIPRQPAWTFDEASGQYYLNQFLPSQPDLNWWNEEVRDAFDDDPALLVRPRRRRLPHRRVPLGHQGPRAARQPARDHGRPLVRADDGSAVGLQRVPARGARRAAPLAQGRRELRPAARAHRRDVRARARSVRERSTATATS